MPGKPAPVCRPPRMRYTVSISNALSGDVWLDSHEAECGSRSQRGAQAEGCVSQ
jgi:hypothetical protein